MALYGVTDLASVNLGIAYDARDRGQHLFWYWLVTYGLRCKTNAWTYGGILTIKLIYIYIS